MGIHKNSYGFTIVETILVFAITGLLLVGVLVGSSIAVNQQRYRDSVSSFLGQIQNEYTKVIHVQNADRTATGYDCHSASGVSLGTTPRGASDCIIIGRVINIDAGKTVETTDLIGYRSGTDPLPDNNIDAIKKYSVTAFNQEKKSQSLAWDAFISQPGNSTPRSLGILLLRSPSSGTVITLINSSSTVTSASQIQAMINNDATYTKKEILCIDSGGLFTGPKNAVVIQKGATGANDVEHIEVGSGC